MVPVQVCEENDVDYGDIDSETLDCDENSRPRVDEQRAPAALYEDAAVAAAATGEGISGPQRCNSDGAHLFLDATIVRSLPQGSQQENGGGTFY